MEKYAVIKLASKQYLVQEGDLIELERQPKPLKIEVLMFSEGGKVRIGEPELEGVSVKATVLAEKLSKKIRVARFKKKSGYEKVKGHRQPISIVKIEKIIAEPLKEKIVEKRGPEGVKIPQKATAKKPIKKVKGRK